MQEIIILSAALVIGVLLFCMGYYQGARRGARDPAHPAATRPIPPPERITEAVDIPEADQQYLTPLTVKVLRHLAAAKRAYPTNAMLIEHLAEMLGAAAGEHFEKRTTDNPFTQSGNEHWLGVAALAIRLYDEGSPHNADNTREQFVVAGHLATRELEGWAYQVNAEIAGRLKGKFAPPPELAAHAKTVAGSPYTADEVDDMKRAFEMKLYQRGPGS